MIRNFIFTLLAVSTFSVVLNAQSERELINEGVEFYKKQKFADSEVNFKKGLSQNPDSPIANFNLGDAYYKQGRYDEAIKSFQSAVTQTENAELKSKAYHNMGNSLLKSQKIAESVEAYKQALKLNPNDQETKYNLSYALSLLNNQQQQQQNQQQNKDDKDNQGNNENKNKDQDQNKDKNKDQNKNQNEQNKPDQNQQANQDNTKQQQQPDQKISKAEAERILEALKNNEKELQKKLRVKKGSPVKTDKDW